jgi:hypothetical protein
MTAPNGAPPPQGNGGIAGAVVRALLGVKDWQRALILMVLGLTALFGAVVWQARDRLANAIAAFFAAPPTLVLAEVDTLRGVAQQLVNPFAPDYGVGVWKADLEVNRRKLLVWVQGDAPLPPEFQGEIIPGYVAPLFVRQRNANLMMVALLDGETVCGEPFTYTGKIEFGCFAGIPPGPGVLIGLIGALYPRALDEREQASARVALREAAERLTVYR